MDHGFRLKLWVGVGAAVLAGAAAPVVSAAEHGKHGDAHQVTAGRGGEGGEGGEGGALARMEPESGFLSRLELMRGHLAVGHELFTAGDLKTAAMHFAHPSSEVYDDVEKELKSRGVKPFREAINRLSEIASQGKPKAEIEEAYKGVVAAIDGAAQTVPAEKRRSAATTIAVVRTLLRTAAHEYEEAVEGDALSNTEEYQDARGFTVRAKALLEQNAEAMKRKDSEGYGQIVKLVAELEKAFPSAKPPQKLLVGVSEVSALVSRIELLKGRFL